MADQQPPTVVEGAGTGDVEDELPVAKSAEDRKAASALASLDAANDDAAAAGSRDVDREAVDKAMKSLGKTASNTAAVAPAKHVKVYAADVALLVEQLELPRARATELLKAHHGNAIEAMRAYVKA